MLDAFHHKPSAKPGDIPDAVLVERACRGDGAAFEVIVRRYNRCLFRAARGVVPNDAVAQEIVQETYLKAFTHLAGFEGKARLKTWLTRIAVNVAISYQRKQRRVIVMEPQAIQQNQETREDAVMPIPPSDRHTPTSDVERQQMKQLLQSAIERLPEKYRCVFMLREVEDLSGKETAQCLDLSEDAVKKRLSRAKAMLRDSLANQIETGAPDTFEFAGKRCDAVTAHVMAEVHRLGLIKPQ